MRVFGVWEGGPGGVSFSLHNVELFDSVVAAGEAFAERKPRNTVRFDFIDRQGKLHPEVLRPIWRGKDSDPRQAVLILYTADPRRQMLRPRRVGRYVWSPTGKPLWLPSRRAATRRA